ncbi:hypothetical protein J4O15_06790 [Lachnoanaerobaculum sp. Marseille-Q4761]|uniref:hypothetical protein n=1 Tax=Lachnoanaerobaculum sp. Marseille-Q4761 TaxID=2819511 RepID=UPI001AA0C943|nr:hypothetical protein [Lachnoanaerobaculum sp. Marseille-Q4761]MBO1870651.1 hypothetical protein [Lachnoanaerobaculum sp. Marseille-Q4761]
MEIKSNIAGMANAENNYDVFKHRLNTSREDLVNIITDIDDYWSGRSGDSFKYICWYLKILLDTGYEELVRLRKEVTESKKYIYNNDYNISNQIQSKEYLKE